jgi:hypothetical protein
MNRIMVAVEPPIGYDVAGPMPGALDHGGDEVFDPREDENVGFLGFLVLRQALIRLTSD